ncbi:MAG: hypothetical protein ABI867_44990, partial [Kofleriaceae bacterium]
MAYRASPGHFVFTGVFALITAAIPPAEVWLAKHLVDLITLGDHAAAELIPTVTALGVLFGMHRAFVVVRMTQQDLFARRVERYMMRTFLTKMASVDVGHFDDPAWHDVAARARRDISWLPSQLTFMTLELVASSASV